jgi:hypothetical protein
MAQDAQKYFLFLVGADPCVCPQKGEHMGSPLRLFYLDKEGEIDTIKVSLRNWGVAGIN